MGTTIYPFRSNQDVPWLLTEAKALGLTELRVEYSRQLVEKSKDDSVYNASQYQVFMPDRMELLRHSGFDFIFTLDGQRRDEKGHIVDFPRNTDGTVFQAPSGTMFRRNN